MDNKKEDQDNQASGKGKRLSDAEYVQIREQYELGLKTAQQLAVEFGVSRQALGDRFKRDGVTRGSRAGELQQAANQGATQAVQQATAKVVERFAEKRLARLEETNETAYRSLDLLKKLADKTLAESIKNDLAPAAIDDDVKAIRRMNLMIVENTEARRKLLGADDMIDESLLPNIVIDDLTAEEILQHHKNIGAADENASIDDLVNIVGDFSAEDFK